MEAWSRGGGGNWPKNALNPKENDIHARSFRDFPSRDTSLKGQLRQGDTGSRQDSTRGLGSEPEGGTVWVRTARGDPLMLP